jgi:hypothetical protein
MAPDYTLKCAKQTAAVNIRVEDCFQGWQKMCLQSAKLAHRMRAASDYNEHSGFDLSEFRGFFPPDGLFFRLVWN